MDYNQIFEKALENLLKDYCDNKICFRSERDLQGHLFHECRKLMEAQSYPQPLKIFIEKAVFDVRSKVDLVLGADEVLIEIKLEPVYPNVPAPVAFTWKKGNPSSIEGDLEKILAYSQKGVHAHFLAIDESGKHARKIVKDQWKQIHVNNQQKTCHYLHVKY